MKAGIVQGLAECAVRVSSSYAEHDAELSPISSVMVCNGYPRRFVDKAISKQLRRRTAPRLQNQGQSDMKTVRFPFVEDLSPEVRRVAPSARVRCVFYTPHTLQSLCCAKDRLPKESSTHVVYSVKCKTCKNGYVGETKRALIKCSEEGA